MRSLKRTALALCIVSLSSVADVTCAAEICAAEEHIGTVEDISLPDRYDGRLYGRVTPVKDQGSHVTCWAHGAVACAESNMLAKNMAALEDLDLSERHLSYFTYHAPQDPLGNAIGDQMILHDPQVMAAGGVRFAAFTLANWVGFADEADVPYPVAGEPVQIPDASLAYEGVVHLKNAYWLDPGDRDQIKMLIMELGAANAHVSGEDLGMYLNRETSAFCSPLGHTDHAVTIVGWDDHYPRQAFSSACQPASDGAWLAKNSWGSAWGDQGYFWISYEDTDIGSSDFSFFEVMSAEEYQYNYHYDGAVSEAYGVFQPRSSFADIFTANAGTAAMQRLQAVSVAVAVPDVCYSLQIYKDVVDRTDPTSGVPALEVPQTGMLRFAGYHTIGLEGDVTLQRDESFSVVLTLENTAGEKLMVYVDHSHEGGWYEARTFEAPGQSFYKNGADAPWQDWAYCEKPGTVRIKAFTSDVAAP